MISCPYKVHKRRDKRGRRSFEDRDRDWSDAAISQRRPGAIKSWKGQRRVLPWSVWREYGPADTCLQASSLQNYEGINSVVLNHEVCGYLLRQP